MENLDQLFNAIVADYEKSSGRVISNNNSYVIERIAKMKSGEILYAETGRKYIRIVLDGSVWGFVVNTHNDPKFNYGDILLAAGWKPLLKIMLVEMLSIVILLRSLGLAPTIADKDLK